MNWREIIRPFNEGAAQYDEWYENNPAFAIELSALQASSMDLPRPRLEIGVGPGRFARALQVELGIDPALAPLRFASRRNIMTMNGLGEHLPIRSRSMGTIYLLFTVCFLPEPDLVLQECSRVLLPEGRLVIGMIPAGSPWGKRVAERGRQNDSSYRYAHVRTIDETARLLVDSGFSVLESWSTLFQPPNGELIPEEPVPGAREDAGFCVLISGKKGAEPCMSPT
jgi:ubiquinone/menaquinone biosynthesis C-methylase UbiE